MLYDDVFRKTVAHRGEQKDPTLDVDKCFKVIDTTIVEACKLRLDGVLAQVGLHPNSFVQDPYHGQQSSTGARGSSDKASDAAAAKATAANETMQRRVEGMQKTMNRQQDQLQSLQQYSQGGYTQASFAPVDHDPHHEGYVSRSQWRSQSSSGKMSKGKGCKGFGKGKKGGKYSRAEEVVRAAWHL